MRTINMHMNPVNGVSALYVIISLLLGIIPLSSDAKNTKEKGEETRPMLYSGHYVGASFGIGSSSDLGYQNGHRRQNPWLKGDPNFYLGYKLDYYWLPRHDHRHSPSFGVGLEYIWGRSHGTDRIVLDHFLYN